MALTPATTDKFTKVGSPGTATTMSAPGYTSGVSSSMQVGSTTNWPTDTKVVYAVDRAQIVNGTEERIAGSYNEFEGIVSGANTISSVVRRLGTAQNYPAGSLTRVYIPVAATRENDMVEGLNQDHNGKGNHKSLTDDNNNEWLERGQTTSAVNQVKITNAITGSAPRVDAAGDDATADIYVGGKGTGVAHAENPELISNFIASGGIIAISAGLIGTFSDIIYYISGKRYKKTTVANKTYTASKDTYVDINAAGTITYSEVANVAASPALAAGNVRIGKVVTSGAAIVAIVQYGRDSLKNPQYPTSPVITPTTQKLWINTRDLGAISGSGQLDIGSTPFVWIDPADYAIPGRTTYMRLVSQINKSAGDAVMVLLRKDADNSVVIALKSDATADGAVPATAGTVLYNNSNTRVLVRTDEVPFPTSAFLAKASIWNNTSGTNAMAAPIIYLEIYWR